MVIKFGLQGAEPQKSVEREKGRPIPLRLSSIGMIIIIPPPFSFPQVYTNSTVIVLWLLCEYLGMKSEREKEDRVPSQPTTTTSMIGIFDSRKYQGACYAVLLSRCISQNGQVKTPCNASSNEKKVSRYTPGQADGMILLDQFAGPILLSFYSCQKVADRNAESI